MNQFDPHMVLPPTGHGGPDPPPTQRRRTQPHPEQRRKRWRIFSRRAPRGDVGVPGRKFDTRKET